MSQTYSGGFLTVTSTGSTVTTGAASATVAIPVASDGNRPRFVRIAAVQESYVKVVQAGGTATANDIMVQPADAVILHIPMGMTHIAYIQGASASRVNIVPLENS